MDILALGVSSFVEEKPGAWVPKTVRHLKETSII